MTRARTVIVIGLASLAAVGAIGGAVATATTGDSLPRRGASWAKLSSDLAAVYRAQLDNKSGLAEARERRLVVREGRVRVVVQAVASPTGARRAVLAAGGTVEASHADLVQALVSPAALGPLSRASAVKYVRAPHMAVAGSVIAPG